jgi:predicted TPR repeat methyltransferase
MEKTFPYENYGAAVAAAYLARQRGDIEEAAGIYRLIARTFPLKKQAITVSADGLKDCGHWTEAVALLESALQSAPQSASYLSSLAEAYREIGDYKRAAGYLQRYLDHDARNPHTWVHLARLHDLAGDHAAAEAAYGHALERDPMNLVATLGRGHSLFQLGRIEDAIACYRRAVASAPQDASGLFALGSALMTQGADSEAHGHLARSLQIDPQNARAHVNFGLTYFNTGNAKEAEAAARNALLVDGELQVAHVLLGLALAEQGDLQGASTALSAAVANTHNSEALFAYAAVQNELGNKGASELALQRILTSEPHTSEARHLLAALHGAAIAAPEEGYASEAFDRIAPRYDNQEMRFRAYRVPTEIASLIEEQQPERSTIARLVDAGCGTGLVAAALHDAFRTEDAVGIDLSAGIAKVAAAKSLYSQILLDDAAHALAQLEGSFDIITAGDLFPYLGDLAAFLRAARARLAPEGLLAYSIELSQDAPMTLAPGGRFVHTQAYVEETARAAGLRPVASRKIVLRRLLGRDVPGAVGLLQV